MVGNALEFKMKKKMKREPPSWISRLLEKEFFVICEDHRDLKKAEVNSYCIDCDRSFCAHCLASPPPPPSDPHQANHQVLQIRRYIYRDVIRIIDMRKHFDCSEIQSYVVNGAKVVLLKTRNDSKPSKSTALTACEICGWGIGGSYRYCSVGCKVSGTASEGSASASASAGEDVGTTSSGPSAPLVPVVGSDPETGEGSSCLVDPQHQPSESSEPPPRKRRRKGIPRRAPFF